MGLDWAQLSCPHSEFLVLLHRDSGYSQDLKGFLTHVSGAQAGKTQTVEGWDSWGSSGNPCSFKSLFILLLYDTLFQGFPDSSVGKESACNAGDPGSIPGSGRFAGEGIGYPLQYFWASLVAQLVKNPPAMRET